MMYVHSLHIYTIKAHLFYIRKLYIEYKNCDKNYEYEKYLKHFFFVAFIYLLIIDLWASVQFFLFCLCVNDLS